MGRPNDAAASVESNADTEPRASWIDHVIAARAQTLEDLAVAEIASVAVVVAGDEAPALAYRLEESALGAGFAVSIASLLDQGLHDLHSLVGTLAANLRVPGVESGRRHGLVAALEAFVDQHGKKSEERFAQRAEEEGLCGELAVLAGDFVAATARAQARRLHAWLGGKDPSSDPSMRTLSNRTAKRALAHLTRLARVLGARGLRVLLVDADALVDLSHGRRDVAYTVLRELIDNTDGGLGMVATEVLLLGTDALERRVHSLHEHPALATRIADRAEPGPPIPHQSWVSPLPERLATAAVPVHVPGPLPPVPEVRVVEPRRAQALRAWVRASSGLPPLEAIDELTVGMKEIDARIDQLFDLSANDGSVFAVLVGEYGSGKTHHLMHLEARAIEARRPVLRLAVERLDEDLGNPQRHLRRLLEAARVPAKRRVGPLERLEGWLAKPSSRKRLHAQLRKLAEGAGESRRAAERALRESTEEDLDDAAVIETLGALDLLERPAQPTYRRDAYARLHLWLELLVELEECEGPVVILDEAENLYRSGVSRAERRTALRSLGFYCGGSLPRACVVLAVTPDTLASLREEAGALLDEIEEQANQLPQEDVAMLRRRLLRARPIHVTKLGPSGLAELAEQTLALARKVRGKLRDPGAEKLIARVLAESETPREVMRRVAQHAERIAWSS